MENQAPFVDLRSFVTEEGSRDVLKRETSASPSTPFLSLYESEEGGDLVGPETEEYVAFLNELYDEEFNEGLSTLVDEAAAVYETRFPYQQEGPQIIGYQAERLLGQYFAEYHIRDLKIKFQLEEGIKKVDFQEVNQDVCVIYQKDHETTWTSR